MGFWNDVKNEWRKPFKWTKNEKEDFWLGTISIIIAFPLYHNVLAPSQTNFFIEILGVLATLLVIRFCLTIFYLKIRKFFK